MITQAEVDKFIVFSEKNTDKSWNPDSKWIIQYSKGKKKKLTYHVGIKLKKKLPGYLYCEELTDNFLESLKFNNMYEAYYLAKFFTENSNILGYTKKMIDSNKETFQIIEIL